ncbi:MAG: hypothetical protein ACRCW9_04000 [Cetobacterium sp.]
MLYCGVFETYVETTGGCQWFHTCGSCQEAYKSKEEMEELENEK